jgi:uncharacterized membrane protein YecN with MAPEG domain
MIFTPELAAAALYAGLNMLILLRMTHLVIRQRIALKIALGDGGESALARVIRGHANAAETIPVTLVLLTLIALAGSPAWVVHILGAAFTLGRGLHAWHFAHDAASMNLRSTGMVITLLVQILAALGLIGHALVAL